MKELTKSLATIQTKMKAKKSSYNSFGKYYFRKSEDILEAIKPFLLKYNVSVVIDEQLDWVSGGDRTLPIIKTTATISDGENAIHATAIVGVDLNQKGMQTAQQFGAASTYGKKYALGNLLLIDDTEDADASNNHGVVSKIKAKAKPSITADQMKLAVEYLKDGGDIVAIRKKYKFTTIQENKLVAAVVKYQTKDVKIETKETADINEA